MKIIDKVRFNIATMIRVRAVPQLLLYSTVIPTSVNTSDQLLSQCDLQI